MKTTQPQPPEQPNPEDDTETFIEDLLDKLLKERRKKKRETDPTKAVQVEDEVVRVTEDVDEEAEVEGGLKHEVVDVMVPEDDCSSQLPPPLHSQPQK